MDILVIRIGAKEITTEEFLKKLEEIYPNYSVEMIEIKSTPPVVEVPWWTGLPERSKLITLRETWIWKDFSKTIPLRKLKKDDVSLEYWGRVVNNTIGSKMVKVYNNPEYWVDAEDVRPK